MRHPKHFDVTPSPLPIQSSEDGGSYYEEIDDELSVPKVMLQQTNNESESNIVNHRITPDDNSRRQLQTVDHNVTDIQTNL